MDKYSTIGMSKEEEMQKIIFATGNKDKMREIRMIMEGLPYDVKNRPPKNFVFRMYSQLEPLIRHIFFKQVFKNSLF